MLSKLTLDKTGCITLPKPVLEALRLSPGDALEVSTSDDKIVLRPLRPSGRMRKKRGLWVYRTGEPLSAAAANETLEGVRRERDEQNLGKRP